jgi:hypothetical protein
MSPNLRSILLGLALGLGPIAVCLVLFYATPYLVEGNPGALLSFGLMGLFFLSSLGVFIVSIMLMVKKNQIIGATALISLILVWISGFSFLISYSD